MDPNDDGEPSDGIDGWRLDVADERRTALLREIAYAMQNLMDSRFSWDIDFCSPPPTVSHILQAIPT